MKMGELQHFTEGVEGFLSQDGKNLREGEVLYYLARQMSDKATLVEIGSWQGKSTIWLGKGVESSQAHRVKIYAIDPHVGSEEHTRSGQKVWTFPAFQNNIKKANLNSLVNPMRMTSSEGAKELNTEIDFIFIDGAHDYDSVKQDFDLWNPKIKKGGIIAFHDSFVGWPGVERVVDRELFFSGQFKKVRYINSITYAVKTDKTTFLQSIENLLTFSIKKVHKFSLHFPQPLKSIVKKTVWRPFRRKWMQDLSQL